MNRACFSAAVVLLSVCSPAFASGPQSRASTDPATVVSAQQSGASPVDIKDLLNTVRLGGAAWSPDGRQIVYGSNASGRINLWLMNADGSGSHQLTRSDDAQSGEIWAKDGSRIVYQQDRGGDEIYDLYFVAASGAEPQNLTNTGQTSETGPQFSLDGKWIAFQTREKQAPYTNLALMDWLTHKIRQLTHEQDPKKRSWHLVAWSPDGRFLFADRGDLNEDSSVYRVNVQSGEAVELTPHQGKVLIEASSISPDGKTLLITCLLYTSRCV